MIAALQRLDPIYGQTARTLLTSLVETVSLQASVTLPRIIGALINDLLTNLTAQTVLVLDDIHLITEPAILAALNYLIDRRPPHLHLVLATRHDPPLALALLRARGLLAEIRLDDLSFTLEETAALLNAQLRLKLSDEELQMLHQHTEGWVAGLSLLAGSLEGNSDQGQRAVQVAHLARTQTAISEVLIDEVLNREPPAIRTFLLETALLEELTPALCQAVTGCADAPAILEDLYRRNLFLVALEAPDAATTPVPTPTYRYHALFATILRQRLMREAPPERVTELYRRALAVETVPARAISLCLVAGLWDEAVQRIEQVGGITLRQGLRHTVQGWLEALPSEVRHARPRLLYLLGVCAWQQGEVPDALMFLERAAERFAAVGDYAGQGEAFIDLSIPLFFQGNLERGLELNRAALELPIPFHSRVHAQVNQLALSLYYRKQQESNQDEIRRLLADVWQADDPETLNIFLSASHPLAATFVDALAPMEQFYQAALNRLGNQISTARVGTESALTAIYFMRGRLEAALHLGRQALFHSEALGGYVYIDAELALMLGQVCVAQANFAQAEIYFQQALHPEMRIGLTDLALVAHLYVLGRMRWQQGRMDAVIEIEKRIRALAHPQERIIAPFMRWLIQGLVELVQQRYTSAAQAFHQAAAIENDVFMASLFGSAAPLLAHLELTRQRPQAALAVFAPLLDRCATLDAPGRIMLEGPYVIPLLRLAVEHDLHTAFAQRILDLMGADQPVSISAATPLTPLLVPETGETLTVREVEVLRLLTAGASNQAIAEQLVISVQTVKSHVAHILRKLDVTSRAQAAARARILGIDG